MNFLYKMHKQAGLGKLPIIFQRRKAKGYCMHTLKRLLFLLVLVACLLGGGYLILSFHFLDLFIDYWWFGTLDLQTYFMRRVGFRYITFLGVIFTFFLVFFFNFFVASRFLGGTIPKGSGDEATTKKYRKIIRLFRAGSLRVYTPLSLLLAVPIAIPFYEYWEKGLLFFYGTRSGTVDPAFGHDISYYLFSLPIFSLLQNRLSVVFLLLFVAILVLYLVENRLLKKSAQVMPRGAKAHLTFLFLVVAAIQAWGIYLKRFALLYTDAHLPLFYGPGTAEMWVQLPSIWLALLFFIATALSLVWLALRRKGWRKLVFFTAGFSFFFWAGNDDFMTRMLQEYYVTPNELVRERDYIANNIKSTLVAYGIDAVETRSYAAREKATIIKDADVQRSLRNIPVWDRELLDDVYKQEQSFKRHYAFPSVGVDRYTVAGKYQQVYLATRELDLEKLPKDAQNWINQHLQYTHGYGVVVTPAAQGGDETMTWFLRDMPPRSDYGFTLKQPGIYFGLGNYKYAIVPNEIGEIDHPGEAAVNVLTNYAGQGGVPLKGILRKAMFWAYFRDQDIVLTTKTNKKSKILLHRNIIDRIQKIAPFFLLESEPYVVVTEKGTYWIQDAYTVSDRYPNAQMYQGKLNYIRNSIKFVVDAYHGTVACYLADEQDPIAKTYQKIYPSLIRPMDKMPKEIRKHLRYPKLLFKIQMEMYSRYHQIEPEAFYRQEDNWELSRIERAGRSFTIQPYYLTLNMLDPEQQDFLLICPMSPMGRNNLRSLSIAGCDGQNYGKLVVYSFPEGKQVYGPSQVDALIDQDTEIAQQLTLWDQAGSQVIRGRTIILPVGEMILYIQPVYLSSTARLKIPELKRLIVSQGDIVAMSATLEEAFQRLEEKLNDRQERKNKRFPVVVPQPSPSDQTTDDSGRVEKEEIPIGEKESKEKPGGASEKEKSKPGQDGTEAEPELPGKSVLTL